VQALSIGAGTGRFRLATDRGAIATRRVVLATGPCQRPRLPACSAALPAAILQLPASAYRNPSQRPAGAALIVGSGSSGCQIAEELAAHGRPVYLSVGRHRRIPHRYRGRYMLG
jgi:putative flavoprotein involved in K+ transport